MANGNGNGKAAKIGIGAAVGLVIFFAGIGVQSIRADANFEPRIEALEVDMSKGERWTLGQQMRYAEQENGKYTKILEKLAALCAAADADC